MNAIQRSVEQTPTGELFELTSARGIAASAVVLYHVNNYADGLFGAWVPVAAIGHLAVDFFFVLSGFVLAHVYGAAWERGAYRHRDFVLRRFARVWPLHAACLAAVGALVAGGSLVGLAPPWPVEGAALLSHVLLLNAVGLPPHLSWNQPAWSVGAEWTAYLCFPLYLALARALKGPVAKLAAAGAVMAALSVLVWFALGADLLTLTANGGSLRIVPSFLAGVMLRQIYGAGHGFGFARRSVVLSLAGLSAIGVAALYAGAPLVAVWPVLGATIYLLALRARQAPGGLLRSGPMVWLGEVSYALYLVHAPVLMATYGVGRKLLGGDDPTSLVAIGAAGALLALVAAAIAHVVIERPAQRFILERFGAGRRTETVAPEAGG